MLTNNSTNRTIMPEDFRIALVVLYGFIFFAGTLNVMLMSCMLQSQRRLTFTKVSVINLIAVHAFFLLTVPFRIYYYASNVGWNLGMFFCKIVSVMIHVHMYLAFVFYVFLLIVRYIEHCNKQQKLEFHRILHATIASVTVWLVIFIPVFSATIANYGIGIMQNDSTQCFHFGSAIEKPAVKKLNYAISILVIMIWSVLALFQVYFLLHVIKNVGTWQRQEFWAQLKNVVFLSVIFFWFLPFQAFRVYYVSEYGKTEQMTYINEIFLAITAFSCFDMIVFAGRDICKFINSKGLCSCI